METERKYLIRELPEDLESYSHHAIEQGYICTDPVIRIRREDEARYLTCKGRGLISRQELNLPMSAEAYEKLKNKVEGYVIKKTRYLIPLEKPRFTEGFIPAEGLSLKVELDVFDEPFSPLILAEVEFPDKETADAYIMEDWFLRDVSEDPRYHNSNMSEKGPQASLP